MDQGEARLILPGRPEFVGVARLAVAGIAARLGFDYDAVEDVKLAVAEAMNLLLRSGGQATVTAIEVVAAWTREVFELTVSQEVSQTGHSLDPEERAFALVVMEALMDQATVDGFETGCPAVRLRKSRAPA